jgi:ABC-type Fe3+ transport system permease subunit
VNVNKILASNLNLFFFGILILTQIVLLLLKIVVSVFLVFSLLFVLMSPILLILNGISIKTEVEKTIFPNQGIWNSLKNTIPLSFMGVIIGTFFALVFQFELQVNSSNRLLTSLLFYVPSNALWQGFLSLGACNKHFILRVILYFKGYIPWNYARFLDYAVERIFLRKVGGGYIFIHRMLMEHFAQMELENKSIQIMAETPNNS